MTRTLALLALALPGTAHAFCGHYLGSADAEVFNESSQVVMVHQDGRTSLTMVNDVETNVREFAMLVPVPEILGEDDISLVRPETIASISQFGAPRLVYYECADVDWDSDADTDSDSDADTDTDVDYDEGTGVTIEAEYTVGVYDIVILSAEQSEGLLTWLDNEGYHVDPDATDLLGEYIEAGVYFFAAKVMLAEIPEAGSYLSPLRVQYDADVMMLPVRLGTLSAQGPQDLIIHTITPSSTGEVRISNYPQMAIDTDCMAETTPETFGDWYADHFQYSYEQAGGRAAYAVEYSWSLEWCDPCTAQPPTTEELVELGFDYSSSYGPRISRLHMRYDPESVDQDLMLYPAGTGQSSQIKIIRYDWQLEDQYPICNQGMAEDPGSCDQDPPDDLEPPSNPWDDESPAIEADGRGCGCTSVGGVGLLGFLGLVGLFVGRRRR